MIGGYVTGPVVLTCSGSLVIAARQVLAFPAGIEVEVEAHARGSRAGTATVAADLPGHPPLEFHVRFADGREDVRLTVWIWPLPPPGPVTVTCSWPSRGLRDARLVLGGDAIQTAARRAQPFWPEPGS